MTLPKNKRQWLILAGLAVGLMMFTMAANFSLPKLAPEPADDEGQKANPIHADSGMWRSAIALALVLGGLYGVNYYIRRRGLGAFGAKKARRLNVIEKFAIDQRRCLLLVSLDGREMLLGVGNDQITNLSATSPDFIDSMKSPEEAFLP